MAKRYSATDTRGMHFVTSSTNVAGFEYLSRLKDLVVWFLDKKGGVPPRYVYHAVPPNVYRDMKRCQSKGRFVWRRLRGKFAYTAP